MSIPLLSRLLSWIATHRWLATGGCLLVLALSAVALRPILDSPNTSWAGKNPAQQQAQANGSKDAPWSDSMTEDPRFTPADPTTDPTQDLSATPAPIEPTTPPSTRPSPTPAGELPPTFGVQFHGTWEMYWSTGANPNDMFNRHLDQLAAHGVGIVRVDVGWSASQPTTAAPTMNTYNQRIGVTLDAAASRGIRVLLTLHQAPVWASGATDGSVKRFPTDPASITGWARWMASTFGPKVTAWEIWNEPNLREFTGLDDPTERASRYVGVLREAHTGLRSGDPHAVVVFGGPAQTDDTFIRDAYTYGAQPYFDIMSLHPYQGNQTMPPESTDLHSKARVTNFPTVANIMAQFGDGAKPVWWTKFGYSVHPNAGVPSTQPWQLGVPDANTSADYLRRQFELARIRYPQVTVAIVYAAYKPASDELGHQHGYRILESDGTPLPQLPALRDYVRQYAGQRPLW